MKKKCVHSTYHFIYSSHPSCSSLSPSFSPSSLLFLPPSLPPNATHVKQTDDSDGRQQITVHCSLIYYITLLCFISSLSLKGIEVPSLISSLLQPHPVFFLPSFLQHRKTGMTIKENMYRV